MLQLMLLSCSDSIVSTTQMITPLTVEVSCIVPHTDLVANYTTKQQVVKQLQADISKLRGELQVLTTKFREAADRYKRCYKTP